MTGFGLSENDANWWCRYEIVRYGNLHAESLVYFYSDSFLYTVEQSSEFINGKIISLYSKILINNIYLIFEGDGGWFCGWLRIYGNSILKFLSENLDKPVKYLIQIVSSFTEVNYYYNIICFDELVTLFPYEIVNDSSLDGWCEEVIKSNPKSVEDYKRGKLVSLNFLKGQVMKLSKGKANIEKVGIVLLGKINNVS